MAQNVNFNARQIFTTVSPKESTATMISTTASDSLQLKEQCSFPSDRFRAESVSMLGSNDFPIYGKITV